jgi:hypothetical protein
VAQEIEYLLCKHEALSSNSPKRKETAYMFYLFILVGLGFELRASHHCLNHTSSPFCSGYFGDGGLVNYLPGLTSNHDPPLPPISASQVARIIGVSYWCLAIYMLLLK